MTKHGAVIDRRWIPIARRVRALFWRPGYTNSYNRPQNEAIVTSALSIHKPPRHAERCCSGDLCTSIPFASLHRHPPSLDRCRNRRPVTSTLVGGTLAARRTLLGCKPRYQTAESASRAYQKPRRSSITVVPPGLRKGESKGATRDAGMEVDRAHGDTSRESRNARAARVEPSPPTFASPRLAAPCRAPAVTKLSQRH
jgi:hypothetical protein